MKEGSFNSKSNLDILTMCQQWLLHYKEDWEAQEKLWQILYQYTTSKTRRYFK